MSEIAAHYHATRERLMALVDGLTDTDAGTAVPGCPEWTVKDVYAHLSGLCADVLAGRTEGIATDPWTARQVAERADRSLATVLGEWRETGSAFEEQLVAFGEHGDQRVVFDIWTHEQDVRGALGKPGGRDADAVPWSIDRLLGFFSAGWVKRGRAPVRVVGSTRAWALGEGDPVATLRADDAELLRLLFGRRSRAQALACWEGDADEVVDQLIVFHFAAEDIVE